VTKGLKAADGHAKLFAGVQVFGGDGQRFVHRAHGLGTSGSNADVYRVFQRRQSVQRDQRGRCVLKRDICGPAAVLRAIAARADTAGRALHQEQGQFSIRNGGHQKSICHVTRRHYTFDSCQRPSGGGWIRFCITNIQTVTRRPFLMGEHNQRLTAHDAGQP